MKIINTATDKELADAIEKETYSPSKLSPSEKKITKGDKK